MPIVSWHQGRRRDTVADFALSAKRGAIGFRRCDTAGNICSFRRGGLFILRFGRSLFGYFLTARFVFCARAAVIDYAGAVLVVFLIATHDDHRLFALKARASSANRGNAVLCAFVRTLVVFGAELLLMFAASFGSVFRDDVAATWRDAKTDAVHVSSLLTGLGQAESTGP